MMLLLLLPLLELERTQCLSLRLYLNIFRFVYIFVFVLNAVVCARIQTECSGSCRRSIVNGHVMCSKCERGSTLHVLCT